MPRIASQNPNRRNLPGRTAEIYRGLTPDSIATLRQYVTPAKVNAEYGRAGASGRTFQETVFLRLGGYKPLRGHLSIELYE